MKRLNLSSTIALVILAVQSPNLWAGDGGIELPDLRGRLQKMIEQRMDATLQHDFAGVTVKIDQRMDAVLRAHVAGAPSPENSADHNPDAMWAFGRIPAALAALAMRPCIGPSRMSRHSDLPDHPPIFESAGERKCIAY